MLRIEREDVEQETALALLQGIPTGLARSAAWRDVANFVSRGRTVLGRMERTDKTNVTSRTVDAPLDSLDVMLEAIADSFLVAIAERLAEGLTQRETAKRLLVDESTVSRAMKKLADRLQVFA